MRAAGPLRARSVLACLYKGPFTENARAGKGSAQKSQSSFQRLFSRKKNASIFQFPMTLRNWLGGTPICRRNKRLKYSGLG